MHYLGYVVVPESFKDQITEYLTLVLKKYRYCDDLENLPFGYENKFDWYEIGGRWNGEFKDISVHFKRYENISENVTTIKKLKDKFFSEIDLPMVPYAFIDSNGEWKDKNKLEKENKISTLTWDSYFEHELITNETPNNLVIVIDFHT